MRNLRVGRPGPATGLQTAYFEERASLLSIFMGIGRIGVALGLLAR